MTKQELELIRKEKEVVALRSEIAEKELAESGKYARTPKITTGLHTSEIIFKDRIEFTLDFALVGIKYKDNNFIKDIVYDVVSQNSKISFIIENIPKLCIWITQYIPFTIKEIIVCDVDNADYKGIIDGVAQALMIDDNGLCVSLRADICPIEHEKSPYTKVTVLRDDLLVK